MSSGIHREALDYYISWAAAELPAAEKNRLSHRGQAMAMLLESLRAEV